MYTLQILHNNNNIARSALPWGYNNDVHSDSAPINCLHYSLAPSGPPLNVRTSALSDSAVVITWDPPAPLERNGIITGYIVNITGIQDGGRKSYPVSESSGSLRIEGRV